MGGGEFAEIPRDMFISITVRQGISSDLFDLRNGVLADRLVSWPVYLLTIL